MRNFRALPFATAVAAFGCAVLPAGNNESAVAGGAVVDSQAVDTSVASTLPLDHGVSGPHDVEFYVQIALDRNPAVRAARRDVSAVTETIPQVTSLDDPLLGEKFWVSPSHSPQTAAGRMVNTLSLSQQVPWPDKLRVRGDVAEAEARMALTRLAGVELTTVEQVRLAYYDVYFYTRAIAITRENEQLLEKLIEFATARYRTGGSQQDVFRVEVERDKLTNQRIEYEQRLVQAQADLGAVMHASPDSQPLAMGSLTVPAVPETLDHLYALSARCRPELRERFHQIIRDQHKRELARLDYVPDLTAGFEWDAMTEDDALSGVADGSDNFGIRLGINLPIYRDRLNAGVRESEHRVVESTRRYEAERDDTYRQIRRLVADAEASERQLKLYRDRIVPNTRKALDVSIADYPTGRGDILQVIDNYSQLLTFEVQIAQFETDLCQALASLERVVGSEWAVAVPRETTVPPPAPDLEEPKTPKEAPFQIDDLPASHFPGSN